MQGIEVEIAADAEPIASASLALEVTADEVSAEVGKVGRRYEEVVADRQFLGPASRPKSALRVPLSWQRVPAQQSDPE